MTAARSLPLLALSFLFLPAVPHAQQASTDPHPLARVSGGVMAGAILYKVPPIYPPEAKAAGISGTVVLRAVIAQDGTVQDLKVVSGPEELCQAALDAVRQWTYRPFLLNGVPTSVDTTVVINFNLNPPPPPPPAS